MTPDWLAVTAPSSLAWRRLDTPRLLALLGRSLPYNVRWTVEGDVLVARGTLPLLDRLATRREPALAAAVRAAATEPEGPAPWADLPGDPTRAAELLEMVRWLAAGMGWKWLEHDGTALRFAVPGESDLPPVAVAVDARGLHVARPLPCLPARDAAPVVRAAVAYGVLVLNTTVPAARVAMRDPEALTLAIESHLPPDGVEEDEVECMLEGVRRAAARANAVFDCIRNEAVARVFATANNLPEPTTTRQLAQEE